MSSNLTQRPFVEVLQAEVKQECIDEREPLDTKPLICLVCGACFVTVVGLQQHYVKHIALKPYKCKRCDKSFLSEKNLIKHEFKHTGLKPFRCDICKRRYAQKLKYEIQCRTHGTEHLCDLCYELFSLNTLSELDEEDQVRHSCDICDQRYLFKPIVEDDTGYPRLIKPYLCQLCGKRFNTRSALSNHSASHLLPNEKFFCNICDEGFTKLPILNEHEKNHVKVKIRPNGICYACEICDTTFPFRRALESHYNDDHEGKTEYKCTVCNAQFFLHHLLQHHKYTHVDQRRFFCDYCPRQYKNKQDLAKHRLLHFGSKQYSCHVCQKRFSTRSYLKQHSIIHTNERPFKCDYCFASFNRKENLERHYLMHVNEKPFKCGKCPASFTRKVALEHHDEVHDTTGEKFDCKYCDESFSRLRLLWKHSRASHPDVTPYYCCDVCGRLFKHQPSFIRHYKLHTGDRPFKCQHCDKAYIQRIHLVKHHTFNHPDLDIDLFYSRKVVM